MSRALIPFAFAALVVALVVAAACAGTSDGDGEVACDSPLDCNLGESCSDGVCSESSEGEGEAGEGEGESTEEEIIQGVCERFSTCQSGEPVATCVSNIDSQLAQLRSRGTDTCFRAAESTLAFFNCLSGLTCDELNSDPFGFCPVGQESNNLQNLCFSGEGEGEGEGEQECFSDADCPMQAFCVDGKCIREEP